jgi:hypothetical protein
MAVDRSSLVLGLGAVALAGPVVVGTYWAAHLVEVRGKTSVARETLDGAGSSKPGPSTEPECPLHSYEHGIVVGRAFMAQQDYRHAARAFDEAVRARPFDARIREERALARILEGTASHEELEVARALAREGDVIAAIDYDQGLLYQRDGDEEHARVSFVRAERNGSTAATQELGSKSRCTVSVRDGSGSMPVGSPSLRREGSRWVLRAFGPDTTRNWSAGLPGDFYTTGPVPATYHFSARAWDDTAPSCRVEPGPPCDQGDPEACPGLLGPRDAIELVSYFDARGRSLANLLLDEGDEARIEVAFAGRTVRVTGGGCDLSVSF